MNKVLLSIAVLAITFSFTSCSDSNSTTKTHAQAKTEKLQLNNGQHWEANPETTEGIQNMVEIMTSFNEMDSPEAFSKLTTKIKIELDNIFNNCTMTGPAHDQLHNFLIPIKESLPHLSSSNISECQESFDLLFEHLGTYDQFFI